jgi:hypothetical protein
MGKKVSESILLEIEETQAALRESIEKTKELAADSDRLLRRGQAPGPSLRTRPEDALG